MHCSEEVSRFVGDVDKALHDEGRCIMDDRAKERYRLVGNEDNFDTRVELRGILVKTSGAEREGRKAVPGSLAGGSGDQGLPETR